VRIYLSNYGQIEKADIDMKLAGCSLEPGK
jgi:hypothetical protein